ncbi:NADP-dependent 3-hydroxy acid dehydrogenase YdfG [Isoptericola sp. CG 20/1183]|uniref:NADP-dependent 3-hydroxy acid dehydrogenase YdfG n=1 Tax=Isoptericola halotolerans TaxID=300560 RepID=A0ABX5ECP4_9MICO|nr:MULTISPECIES: SDR family NAD(P)-dependent oxidoreductase [Isoptericola]PRZ05534.1 NADP-dependent 3-hydroxy acid dehydrogenase YdfG [Isoptericola halotolerans]PRZ06102.1 NADP-dependent 3-hydroxy acid dehydrogenase YdfG [Isoptericola sp. CG 20/1183]
MAEHGVPAARTALVTGATRGIGRAVALGLADAGLDVALLARDAVRLTEVADLVRERGRTALALEVDVTDPEGVAEAVGRAEAPVAEGGLGGVDLLVNNAGRIDTEVPLWEADADEWWSVVETNVRGPFLLARHLVPGMLSRGGGRVVDLNSGAGTHDMTVASAYNVSKTALLRLGHHLDAAGAERGLRVFEVAPGTVATDMTGSMPMHAERTEWTPVERTVEMIAAIATGALDACAGWYIRVTHDTPSSLQEMVASGSGPTARHLRVLPANGADPLGADLTGR